MRQKQNNPGYLNLEGDVSEDLEGPGSEPNGWFAPVPHGDGPAGVEPPHHPGVLLVHLLEDLPHHLHVVVPQLVGQSDQMNGQSNHAENKNLR